ncbi:MAG: 16S rRNA (cytosine(1402)-N(4))-methyltransferase RsmH [Planctomycetes bacterium]|nr:16S rRNA (cytosine(1402)-N(4))-methyltransferase RsmH [Planctomycetota bacterium]
MTDDEPTAHEPADGQPFRRRQRYRGTHPRNYDEKYKELSSSPDPETIAKLIGSGKTPAGQHRPILVTELLERLAPQPGERGADVTLGHGGHSEALLTGLQPGGQLLALDVDALQLPLTEERLRGLGYAAETLIIRHCNFAGLAGMLPQIGWHDGVDFVLADLGLSSMQIDNPARGFSFKHDGPLDMRMNPERGVSARDWLRRCRSDKLVRALADGSDEPLAEQIAAALAELSKREAIDTTGQLRRAIENALPNDITDDGRRSTVARVFQAIRIAVNEEFNALDAFLRHLPDCLLPGGRVAILSFHSGEDRRVKHHFRDGARSGVYREIASDIIRPTGQEVWTNSRAASAKMRWAIRG